MGACESCPNRNNPIGHCVREYKIRDKNDKNLSVGEYVIRDAKGYILSREMPRIICKELTRQIPSEFLKPIHKIQQKTEYVSDELQEQQNNYQSFYEIASKCVSPSEEQAILKTIYEDYWEEWTGISRILEKEGHHIVFSFALGNGKIHKPRSYFKFEDLTEDIKSESKTMLTKKQYDAVSCKDMAELAKRQGVSKQAIFDRRVKAQKIIYNRLLKGNFCRVVKGRHQVIKSRLRGA